MVIRLGRRLRVTPLRRRRIIRLRKRRKAIRLNGRRTRRKRGRRRTERSRRTRRSDDRRVISLNEPTRKSRVPKIIRFLGSPKLTLALGATLVGLLTFGAGGGAVAGVAGRGLAGGAARGVGLIGSVGKFAVTHPKAALFGALAIPTTAGILVTPLGKKLFSPSERFKTGKSFGEDPLGFIAGIFKKGGRAAKGVGDRLNVTRVGGGLDPSFFIPFLAGLGGIGAGLAVPPIISKIKESRTKTQELIGGFPSGDINLSPPVVSGTDPIGAVQEEKPKEEKILPTITAPDIKIKISNEPRISVKPKIINIQQSLQKQ